MTTENAPHPLEDLDALRERLAGASGQSYWRSLEEYSQTEGFQQYIHNEFPVHASAPADDVTRRNFLQVMGATLALAGVTTGCGRQPKETIHPYVNQPEDMIPGKPLFFATAFVQNGYAKGVLVESHMGRPTKIEGLPGHPASLGRTDARTQASILDMYDPDRSKIVERLGFVDSWENFVAEARGALDDARTRGGEGVRVLTETITSPTTGAMLEAFLSANPRAKWHQYEASGRDNEREGARLAFGNYVDAVYHFDKADVVVSLDADYLDQGAQNVRNTADYAQRRDVVDHAGGEGEEHAGEHFEAKLNRTYAFESSPTNVGAGADHRFPVRPSQVEAIARSIAEGLGISALGGAESGLTAKEQGWVDAVVADLDKHRGGGLVIAGRHQPPAVHALAHIINAELDNAGTTVDYITPVDVAPVNQMDSLRELVSDMADGKVDMLLILGGNPVYNAPAELNFLEALKKVPLRAHLSGYVDETSKYCQWQVPELHYLEGWADARAYDGTVSLVQPLIAPLYAGKTATEFLSALVDEEERSSHDIVQAYWKEQQGEDGFDAFWRSSLARGFIADSAFAVERLRVRRGAAGAFTTPDALGADEFEFVILPDPSVGNGSASNNAWLQEVPNPLTKLTWDNAVIMGYSTALDLGLKSEDVVEVSYNGRTIQGPVWIHPGHCGRTVTLHLGYGRTAAGKVADGIGFSVYSLQTADAPTMGRGVTLSKVGATYPLARTEEHYNMEGRELVRHFTEQEYTADSHIVKHGRSGTVHVPAEDETLYHPEEKKWDGYAWGMTIDLNKCTGCNACIVACQSENIIPVVGKTELRKGREMHWIRVDRYFHTGSERELKKLSEQERREILDNASVYYQPVPCMQCENAPCELVCPVGATQHSREGLNDMIYNRCIGTRYCSNNCPYKVRRFNFFNYSRTPLGSRGDRVYNPKVKSAHINPESLKPMRNPDVSVRTRGVMEKCTYCVQRINEARIDSKKSGNPILDGDCVVACQQACPAGAIVFGDINNPDSEVSARKGSHRNYGILEDLNTRPRTTYLARITNPNPELQA